MFKWMKDARRLPEVERQLSEANVAAMEANARARNAEAASMAAQEALSKANAEAAELKKKVRDQNEADLLLVSLQIVKRITDGEKRETSPGLQTLLDQQAALRSSPYQSYSGYGNMLGSLGLGGLLGGYPH